MSALLSIFLRDNVWWRGARHVDADRDLVRLRESPISYLHPIPFDLGVDAVYTLRGPRQVGKSTLLKRVVAHLLTEVGVNPRQVLYADAEGAGLTTHTALADALTSYLAWARSALPRARLYLLLDEVTGIRDWGIAIRTLFRQGHLEQVTAIATGSHALDLARGGETAPGRRGERDVGAALDWIMMPLSFRQFVSAHAPDVEATLPLIDVFDPRAAAQATIEISLHGDTLRALFQRYLASGGYPHAMADEHARGAIGPGIYLLYRSAIIGQMKRAGHSEGMFREVVAWAADNRLGHEFSWQSIAAETDIGSKDTARRYVEDAEHLFLWHVLYRAQGAADLSPAFRSPKKLYPMDPFTWHVLASWAAGDSDPWAASLARLAAPALAGHLIEGVAADHFLRAYGHRAVYHRSERGEEEIDLLLARDGAIARLEVKFRAVIPRKTVRHLARYGGGIIATPDTSDFDPEANVAQIPVYALLAGQGETVTLFPAEPT